MTPVIRSGSRSRGISMVEALIALPLLFIVGLGAVQFALVMHARQALNFALIEAARAGSVGHAETNAIRSGLSRGLVPWLYGANDLGEYALNLARAAVHIRQGEAIGWIQLAQLSPTNASFDDWAEPARDANGGLLADVREIPNDNLVARAEASGAPVVGAASGQTLADANLLRLRLDYGVPLVVPVVGRLNSSAVRVWNGCEIGSPKRIGLIKLDTPKVNLGPRPFPCAMYGNGLATASGVVADIPRLPRAWLPPSGCSRRRGRAGRVASVNRVMGVNRFLMSGCRSPAHLTIPLNLPLEYHLLRVSQTCLPIKPVAR